MSIIDWIILFVYMIGLIWMSIYLSKGQENQEDYYVGGRNLPWWAIGLSTMATQSSAISFISIPAFVALRQGGGLRILQWEFALPLAMIFIMIFLLPFFRHLKLISVYEYLEMRFSPLTRSFISAVFTISRTIATGVGVYAVAIVLSVVLNLDPVYTVILIGVVTVIYDTIGGMKAVVYSDVVQMAVLLIGVLATIIYSIKLAGGWSGVIAFAHANSDKFISLDFSHHGIGDGNMYNFYALLFGAFFLYASYYGTDQTQTQRELSAPNIADTKKSLVFNGFFRFPLIVLYSFIGITVGAALFTHPQFQTVMAKYIQTGKYDYVVPIFIYNFLPVGLRGLIFSAILAAAMSSLDSAINSLSAVFMRDFYERYISKDNSDKNILLISKILTATFGTLVILIAIALTKMHGLKTLVELINQVGSLFYGPILATFLVGITLKRINSTGAIVGLLSGVLFNMILWLGFKNISWLWWNVFGTIVTIIFAYLISLFTKAPDEEKISPYIIWNTNLLADETKWVKTYVLLFSYFLFMVLISYLLPKLI